MAHSDFNGDGRDDILWRHSTGSLTDWLATPSGGFTGNDANALNHVPMDWAVRGVGDFNGDGRDDILWRNSTGTVTDWLATASGGFTGNDANALNQVSTNWQVAGIGDFNGDGRHDILWHSSTGALTNWLATSSGGFTSNDLYALNQVSTNWRVAGTGDFNGDGRDDILWRDSAGTLTNWLGTALGGFTSNDVYALNQVPTNWTVAGTGDFNGDGRDDILWRDSAGALTDWLGTALGGFVSNDANAFYQVSTDWQVTSTGDFNGDRRDDILWRNNSGAVTDWLGTASGGFTGNEANAFSVVSNDWVVQPSGSPSGGGGGGGWDYY